MNSLVHPRDGQIQRTLNHTESAGETPRKKMQELISIFFCFFSQQLCKDKKKPQF